MRFAFALFTLFAAMPACTQFPALEGTVSPEQANAPFPDVVPLAPLLAQASMSGSVTELALSEVEPRLAELRARAAGLRGPVIPADERERMLRGLR